MSAPFSAVDLPERIDGLVHVAGERDLARTRGFEWVRIHDAEVDRWWIRALRSPVAEAVAR